MISRDLRKSVANNSHIVNIRISNTNGLLFGFKGLTTISESVNFQGYSINEVSAKDGKDFIEIRCLSKREDFCG